MKKQILFLLLILISCKSYQKISTSERVNILSELDSIGNIDQKYSGIAFPELTNKYGKIDGWKIFEAQRDSVGMIIKKGLKNYILNMVI